MITVEMFVNVQVYYLIITARQESREKNVIISSLPEQEPPLAILLGLKI